MFAASGNLSDWDKMLGIDAWEGSNKHRGQPRFFITFFNAKNTIALR